MDYFVYATEAEALADEALIYQRGTAIAAAMGYALDAGVVGKAANLDRPDAARTAAWCEPRQRLDGLWLIAHPSRHPSAEIVLEADGRTYAEIVAAGITAPVETESADWWPPEE